MIRELFIRYSGTYFLPSDQAYLVRGLIYGDDSELSAGMKQLFQGLGLSHFTAASGANLRLLFPDWLSKVLIFRWQAIWLLGELCGVSLYLRMAAFSPSLWRATLFWSLSWLARLQGRKIPPPLLFFYVILLTLILRREYFGSLGFQLSFLCVLAVYFSQIKGTREIYLRESCTPSYFISIREIFRESLFVFIFLAPLLYFRFQTLAPIGVIGTIVLTPFLQLLTQLGLINTLALSSVFLDKIMSELYSVIRSIFFVLWFVDTSVLRFAVWAIVFISILKLLLQLRRWGVVWREIQ